MSDTDFRKISLVAIILLVVLRMSLGWQLMYEGLWKLQTQKTANPWTAEPYLKNAQGPFRDYFRNLTGDPNDFRYLNHETVEQRWSEWATSFANHYQLSENQLRSLNNMIHGPAEFRRALPELPAGVELPKEDVRKNGLYYDDERKHLVVEGRWHMTPRDKQEALAQVGFVETRDSLASLTDPVQRSYAEEVIKLFDQQAKLSFMERALGILKGDPDYASFVDNKQKGTIDELRRGKIQIYRDRLERYEEKLKQARTHFDQDHLAYDWKEIQKMRSELVGPIRNLEREMKWQAERLLTTEQLARGSLPQPMTSQRKIDLQTMYALTILGGLLIAGLFTRIAALGGAFLLMNFYMAYPPFPGYPPPPGTEHAMIVNKVFLEALMLVTLAALPTGRWFGIDAIFSGLFTKSKPDDRR